MEGRRLAGCVAGLSEVWCFAGSYCEQMLAALSARKLGHLGASPSALPAMQRAEWRV